MTTPLRQLALQAAASIIVLSLAWPYYGMRAEPMPWDKTAMVMGVVAFIAATLTRQPIWWRIMHAVFMPLAWAVTQLDIDPIWFLLAFGILLLIYRGAVSGRVPLYFSNSETIAALETLLAGCAEGRFVDLGAGIGSIVLPLARRYPAIRFVGIENAPLPWLIGRWRTRGQKNLDWRWGNLWTTDLSAFNFVYAFLSPAPMAQLWQKAGAEMGGGWFVSNSFAVPEIEPEQVIETDCFPPRPLYCYRVGG
ncbi:MAG: class I SAM-dependent methyltransferase [Betaproteobacteria bacterium]